MKIAAKCFIGGFPDQSRGFDFGHKRNKHAFEYLFYDYDYARHILQHKCVQVIDVTS